MPHVSQPLRPPSLPGPQALESLAFRPSSPRAQSNAKVGVPSLGGALLVGIYHRSDCFNPPAYSLYSRSWTEVPLVLFYSVLGMKITLTVTNNTTIWHSAHQHYQLFAIFCSSRTFLEFLAFFDCLYHRAGARSKTLGWRQQTKSQNIGVAAGVAANEKSKYWGGSCHPCHPSSDGPANNKIV